MIDWNAFHEEKDNEIKNLQNEVKVLRKVLDAANNYFTDHHLDGLSQKYFKSYYAAYHAVKEAFKELDKESHL